MRNRSTAWANAVRREVLCLPELICANTSRPPGNVVTDKPWEMVDWNQWLMEWPAVMWSQDASNVKKKNNKVGQRLPPTALLFSVIQKYSPTEHFCNSTGCVIEGVCEEEQGKAACCHKLRWLLWFTAENSMNLRSQSPKQSLILIRFYAYPLIILSEYITL